VRQLEAIIRIAESCAKMRLSEVATEDDVGAAIQP
jgi:DNA replicative helicase MCM subunit Mcm2 (Cdc46/Mcm family)